MPPPGTASRSVPLINRAGYVPIVRQSVDTPPPTVSGSLHIGHVFSYTQTDIMVRHQRMLGSEVHFVGADDAHGAPIMIAAEKAGKTPQDFVAGIAAATPLAWSRAT